jgi:hypothetical protein
MAHISDKLPTDRNFPRRGKFAQTFRKLFLKPSIQKDLKFKLMFLRADQYNARQAAEWMAKYYSHKLYLFGEDTLVKKITLDDLESEML